ncbi:MAG TPA: histidine kinase [Niabella sp.]|jgi:two-component system LytT family sensor kinase|nr:histidine kinase [Chitinophagaceae bacterium]HRO84314.1 histidine kinase [Niabella sp.]
MQSNQPSARRFLLSLGIGWLVLFNTQIYLLSNLNFSSQISILDSLISNTLLLLAGLLVLNMIKYYIPTTTYQYVSVIAACLVLAGLWLFITNSFLKILINNSQAYSSFLENSLIIRFSFAFLVITIVTIAAILWYNWIDRRKTEQRKTDTEKLSRDAELYKLRQQLQPHFLFNSLNSINALIAINPKQARKMVQQLSDFLRGTLKKEESQMVTLDEEVSHLNLYLEIEKVRFGNRLVTEINIAEECKQKLIPALLLQPVVENAIKFGLYDTTGDTLIKIECVMEGNNLCVEVSNPHDPTTSIPVRGTGFGLSSINRRLYLLFARNDLLTTESGEEVFKTIVRIPQEAVSSKP